MASDLNTSDVSGTTIIIPAFNEQQGIIKVLQAIDKKTCLIQEIIVVNNSSSDNTADLASQAGATVLDEPKRGYGQACLCALHYIEKQPQKPNVIVFLDADYSDYPEEMIHLLRPIWADKADLVIGSRVLGNAQAGAMTLPQRWGNWLVTVLLYLLYKHKATDLGPFRAARYTQFMRLKNQDTNYGWNVEMQIKALRLGLRTIEVPVSYRPRLGTSKISATWRGVLGAGYKIIFTIFKYYFNKHQNNS